ncbi:MAG TPA: hypothetical protein VF433_08550, partial [Cellvibrio sp.]
YVIHIALWLCWVLHNRVRLVLFSRTRKSNSEDGGELLLYSPENSRFIVIDLAKTQQFTPMFLQFT